MSSCKKDDSPLPEDHSVKNCFKKETTVYEGSVKVGTTLYHYNDKDQLEQEISYDIQMNRTDSAHFTYTEDGLISKEYYYNFMNSMIQEKIYEYDSEGLEIMNQVTVNGVLVNRFELFRGEDGLVDSVHLNSQGIITRLIYVYENDKVKTINEYSTLGDLIRRREYTYADQETTLIIYGFQNNVETKNIIQYDEEGREVGLKVYDENDSLIIDRKTEYDEKGNVVKVTADYIGFAKYVYETTWECE